MIPFWTNFKLIFSDSLMFYLRNFRQIVVLCGPFLLAGSFISFLVTGMAREDTATGIHFLISFAASMALYPIYTGALIQMMAAQARNELPSTTQLIAASLNRYAPLLMLVVIARILIMLGIMAFILPGMWLAARFSFAEFYVVLEKPDPREALIRSFRTTREHFVMILAVLVILAVPIFLLVMVMGRFVDAVAGGPVLTILADALVTLLALFIDVVMFRVFMDANRETPAGAPDAF